MNRLQIREQKAEELGIEYPCILTMCRDIHSFYTGSYGAGLELIKNDQLYIKCVLSTWDHNADPFDEMVRGMCVYVAGLELP